MGRLRFYVDWLTHFLVANSRHGTHSPFVYRLVDNVVYGRLQVGEPRDKRTRLIARLIDWFQPDTVYDMRIDEHPPISRIDFVVADCVHAETLVTQLDRLWPRLHTQSVFVLLGCHRTAGANLLWQSIKNRPEVTVTIDLFDIGLVFFHSGQAKEDFKIRY